MSYQLKKFDTTTVDQTEEAWINQAKKHKDVFFPTQIEKDFSWVRQFVDGTSTDGVIHCGLFYDKSSVADATLELVHTRKSARSAWLKMLTITFCPDLLIRADLGDKNAVISIVSMFNQAIAGCIQLSGKDHKADTLKLYGRSNELLQFFKYYVGVFKMKNIETSIEGRWLVFRPTR